MGRLSLVFYRESELLPGLLKTPKSHLQEEKKRKKDKNTNTKTSDMFSMRNLRLSALKFSHLQAASDGFYTLS